MFYLTGIQHTKTGDVVIPTLGYEHEDEYLQKWHHEMDYAMSNDEFLGLNIIVFNESGQIVLNDKWVKTNFNAENVILEENEDEE